MATYRSNHTLEIICEDGYEDMFPQDLLSLLRLNRENSMSQAAGLKIIKTHFTGDDIDMQPSIDMELSALPSAIARMGRDGISETEPGARGLICSISVLVECSRRYSINGTVPKKQNKGL